MPVRVTTRTSPVAVLPTTWIVAVPLKIAWFPLTSSDPAVTSPLTSICEMLAHGPNGNPPERPDMTQRNCPPDDDALNPSCDVVPSAPSTTPPPETLGLEAKAADCAASRPMTVTMTTSMARQPNCFMPTSPNLSSHSVPVRHEVAYVPRGWYSTIRRTDWSWICTAGLYRAV